MADDQSKPVVDDQSTAPETPPPAEKEPTIKKRRGWKIPLIVGVVAAAMLFGVPRIRHALRTVSTDDAYVNSYVTFVAPRVAGQVLRVLVDDNNRVKKGDILVELDPEPFQVQVAIKEAAVEAAKANLIVANATVRSQVGQLRGLRFKLQHAIEDVHNQIALIRARAATWEQSKATLVLAQSEFERAKKLLATKVISPEDFDQKREALDVAEAQVKQSLENIYQARVALGLSGPPPEGGSVTDVPPDLDQNFSSVRQALGEVMQGAAALGIESSSFNLTPQQTVSEFLHRDPGGDIDRIYAEIIKKAPTLIQAEVGLIAAKSDLEQAQLNLRYCTIVAEIDGVVTRRNVNPGNHVQVGQSLMAIRSLSDIWVDANFKETQLQHLRIGQRAEIKVDMYGSSRTFEGRVSGFTIGTGSTLALLPPQNATGNFVKVVQRLPVRIDIVDYNPEDLPLFVGLSVEPSVDIKSPPTGPNAGKFLQQVLPSAPTAKP